MELALFIIFIAFCTFFGIQFLYHTIVFSRFSFAKNTMQSQKHIPVSVIVCAKNEHANLKNFLPHLINQKYESGYEIVLIDDASTDDTLELMEEYAKNYNFIKLVKVENNEAFWGNKKFALTLGIKASKNEYLIFTDADCYPATENWINEMASHFTMKKTIVLGYGAYEKVKGSFLNKLIRYETVLTAIQYFSWTIIGKPYMGVGRNMAYKKSEFYKANGFINHMKVRSGDDDLFVNEAANSTNTTIVFNPESVTFSKAKKTYKEWFYQKRRHLTTAKFYKGFDKFQLGLYFFSKLFFYITLITLLAFQYQWLFVCIGLGLYYLISWLFFGLSASKLKEKDLIIYYPIFDIFLLLTQLNVGIINTFKKPVLWK